jgi:hypothetical protein
MDRNSFTFMVLKYRTVGRIASFTICSFGVYKYTGFAFSQQGLDANACARHVELQGTRVVAFRMFRLQSHWTVNSGVEAAEQRYFQRGYVVLSRLARHYQEYS